MNILPANVEDLQRYRQHAASIVGYQGITTTAELINALFPKHRPTSMTLLEKSPYDNNKQVRDQYREDISRINAWFDDPSGYPVTKLCTNPLHMLLLTAAAVCMHVVIPEDILRASAEANKISKFEAFMTLDNAINAVWALLGPSKHSNRRWSLWKRRIPHDKLELVRVIDPDAPPVFIDEGYCTEGAVDSFEQSSEPDESDEPEYEMILRVHDKESNALLLEEILTEYHMRALIDRLMRVNIAEINELRGLIDLQLLVE